MMSFTRLPGSKNVKNLKPTFLKIIVKNSKNETNLDIDLVSLVQDQVHVLVETNDDALEANIDDIVQPDLEKLNRGSKLAAPVLDEISISRTNSNRTYIVDLSLRV